MIRSFGQPGYLKREILSGGEKTHRFIFVPDPKIDCFQLGIILMAV